jgi:hypothetical protein
MAGTVPTKMAEFGCVPQRFAGNAAEPACDTRAEALNASAEGG